MYDVIYTWNLKQSNSEAESTGWLPRVGGRKIWGDVGHLNNYSKFKYIITILEDYIWLMGDKCIQYFVR